MTDEFDALALEIAILSDRRHRALAISSALLSAVKREREECAKRCDELREKADAAGRDDHGNAYHRAAFSIRARGNSNDK
jgi:hypothetical protein